MSSTPHMSIAWAAMTRKACVTLATDIFSSSKTFLQAPACVPELMP